MQVARVLGSNAPHFDLGIDAKPQFNFDDLPSMMDSQERGGGISFAHRIQSLCGCGGPVACGKLVTSLGLPVLGVVTWLTRSTPQSIPFQH